MGLGAVMVTLPASVILTITFTLSPDASVAPALGETLTSEESKSPVSKTLNAPVFAVMLREYVPSPAAKASNTERGITVETAKRIAAIMVTIGNQ